MEKDTNWTSGEDGEAKIAVLFDFDGVLMDTEGQYTEFWSGMGAEYLGDADFGLRIKGQSLKHIFDTHFTGQDAIQAELCERLYDFEHNMKYEYIAGVEDFLHELHEAAIPTAVVTSSNDAKMQNVYRAHPELKGLFSKIITSEMFERSKPAPDCFLLGMKELHSRPESTVVFEDSYCGLDAARTAGCFVAALATTNKREDVAAKADAVIDDFREMSLERLREWFAKR